MSDIIVVRESAGKITVTASNPQAVASPKLNVAVAKQNSVAVATQSTTASLRSVGVQGPSGPGSPTLQAPAGEAISAYQVVVLINGQLFVADPTNPAHANYVAGVATQSGIIGTLINYTIMGLIGGGSFVVGARYFVGLAGTLSTSPRAAGATWVKLVGSGYSLTQMVIELGPTMVVI